MTARVTIDAGSATARAWLARFCKRLPMQSSTIRRTVPSGQIKAAGDGRGFRAIASTGDVDRQGDRIAVDGWRLSNFRRNPVVCWAHDYSKTPVARATWVGVVNDRLEIEFEFPEPGVSRFSDDCVKLIDAGMLGAVSVGFLPLRWEYMQDGMGRLYREQELLEVSLVVVPANAQALIVPNLVAGRSASFHRPRLAARAVELARLRAA